MSRVKQEDNHNYNNRDYLNKKAQTLGDWHFCGIGLF